MIKHIVCFKLKDNSLEECEKAANILKSMEGNVPFFVGLRSVLIFFTRKGHTTSFCRLSLMTEMHLRNIKMMNIIAPW